jgi:hypothetical protein
MYKEIGFKLDAEEEFKSRSCVHMDCFRFVPFSLSFFLARTDGLVFLPDGSSVTRTFRKAVKV